MIIPRIKLWVKLISVILLMLTILLAAHFWIAHRLQTLRAIFPIEAAVVNMTVSCSIGSPNWMEGVIKKLTLINFSPSNQLAYVTPDGIAYHCENGWSGYPLLSNRVSASTRYRYASLTKVLTADLILKLVDANKLELTSRVIDFFPEITSVKDKRIREITISDLLTHRGGFDRYNTPDPMLERFVKPWCPYNIGHLSEIQLDFQPRGRYSYSNVGYCLLGVVAERISGVHFRGLIEEIYRIEAKGLKFTDGPYMADEVKYDFRNSDFYGETYYSYFDFSALSSSAGLTGGAMAYASLISEIMSNELDRNAYFDSFPNGCGKKLRDCYGFAFFPYSLGNTEVMIQEGFLPGTISFLVVDESGGVLVFLGAGAPYNALAQSSENYNYLSKVFNEG